jgi:glycosyltransferase involved in cell wall biosynthesis
MSGHSERRVLFRRDYHGFTGGHLKLRDYFDHTSRLPGFRPEIHFTAESRWDGDNPWAADRNRFVLSGQLRPRWDAADADILFVEGLDWPAIPADNQLPVINLVQGMRHSDPLDPRYAFLGRPAVRICVSDEVACALRDTKRVNGPVHAIRACLDWSLLPPKPRSKDISLLIAGLKQPDLAADLSRRLDASGIRNLCLTTQLPRADFLEIVARAQTAVFLPLAQEGFYLPALEAMSLGTLVICPDCVGNRGFCRDRITCLCPEFTVDAIEAAVIEASRLSRYEVFALLASARRQPAAHTLEQECESYHRILSDI